LIDIAEVAENIYQIDAMLYGIPEWGSVYLINEDSKALVDTGPATSAPVVLGGIRQLGIQPGDIDYLVVTHIHLDHAGAAGLFLREMPGAKVVVHHRGARHLINPEKLISDTRRIAGEEALAREGEPLSVAEDRVKPVRDGDTLALSDEQVLEFMDTPGHAPHELCIYERRNGGVFTGDGAGISVAQGRLCLPATPGPHFDFEKYTGTIRRLMEMDASQLYYAHFGVNDRVRECLGHVMEVLQRWDGMVTAAASEKYPDGLIEKMGALVRPEMELVRDNELLYRHLTVRNLSSAIKGFLRYYRDRNLLN